MSNHKTFSTTLWICLAIIAALSTATTAKTEKQSPPTSQPAKTGAVQKALRKLYAIPRTSISNTTPQYQSSFT